MDLISSSTLLSFMLTCLVIESTPGPNMAYLAILSASDGRKAGLAATAGIALGLLVVGITAAMGVAALISSSALAYQILRWGGVCYLLWLAWDGWKTEPETSPGKMGCSAHRSKFFKRGLIINLLNPKAAVFYIAILPEFIVSSSSIVYQAVTLTTIYVMLATSMHILVVTLAGTARQFLEDSYRRLVARRILSITLAAIAFWFAWTTGGGR